jgi:OmcA/MtrC family decaheme c-type cytochrome
MRTAWREVAAGLCLALVGPSCEPKVGPRTEGSSVGDGHQISIAQASVNGSDQVVVSYTLTQDGQGLTGAAASSLKPTWTLAGLSTDPVSNLPAWQSHLLTGSGTLLALPIDGPGTPPAWVLANVKQPGSETGGTVLDLGGGSFRYTFQNALPAGFDPGQTLRVGVWLAGVAGSRLTTSTFDFVPSGGAPQQRELVLDANCDKCHGTVQAHGGYRTGVPICLTCHTYQNADPDTVDPAALAGATAATNPNPLDLGRLVHRIHRGKNLPTLYAANAAVANPAATPPRPNVALPFNPTRNAPLVGRKYSIVGYRSEELVYGQVVNRTDNNQAAKVVATGVRYPQDLRNCDGCHGGAAQASEHVSGISRRTCAGCHPDVVWTADAPDPVHFPHPGGVQVDDTLCVGCHVPTPAKPAVDAPHADIHVPLSKSPHHNGLVAEIAAVGQLQPGLHPRVIFTLSDRDGTLNSLASPTPSTSATSPVPRALARVAITVSGPTAPDYLTGNLASTTAAPITEVVPLTIVPNASGQFTYTFTSAIPASATGTWAVAIEARRAFAASGTGFYDPATDRFPWPYTGETIYETADNPIAYVDTSVGSSWGGSPIPRREVVSRDLCDNCHLELAAHGELRHKIEYCVMCHTPDATDWGRRPKATSGNTDLSATYDGIEERSVRFKVLIGRIHTGGRTGAAELGLAPPFAVYGYPGGSSAVYFFDDVRFPNDLENCALCHVGASYTLESIPAGSQPTVANETPTIQHQATPAHGATETRTPPFQAACRSCHDTGAAQLHAQGHTTSAGEQCTRCHGVKGSMSVKTAHGLQ